jgi:hypothetical protein
METETKIKRYNESQKACIKRYYEKHRDKINAQQRERYKKKVEFNKKIFDEWKTEFETKFKQKLILEELNAVNVGELNEKVNDDTDK